MDNAFIGKKDRCIISAFMIVAQELVTPWMQGISATHDHQFDNISIDFHCI